MRETDITPSGKMAERGAQAMRCESCNAIRCSTQHSIPHPTRSELRFPLLLQLLFLLSMLQGSSDVDREKRAGDQV